MTTGRDFELGTVLAELRRRAGLIFLCTLLSAGLAFGLSQLVDERYDATADLLFVETNPNAPERTAATNLALSSLDAVMFRVKLAGANAANRDRKIPANLYPIAVRHISKINHAKAM